MFQPGVFALGKKYRTSVLPEKSLSERISPSWSGNWKSGALSWMDMKVLQRAIILHRGARRIACALLCLSILCGFAAAQQRRKQKTPRALALVEWPAKGNPVVVPIAILIDGHFYDASIYMADPVPMALEDGTVYEVEKSGSPLGFATVGMVRGGDGHWVGMAKYQTEAEVVAATTRKEAPAVRSDPDEGPPKLTRDEKKTAAEAPAAAPPASPKAGPPTDSKQEPAAGKSDDDRPRLQRPNEPQPAQSAPAASPAEAKPAQSQQDDADYAGRPRLRRGKPVETNVESAPAPSVARLSTATITGRRTEALRHSPVPGAPVKILPAISDAGGPEPASYLMPGSETVPPRLVSAMDDLARSELQKYADSHGGAHVGALEDVDIRAFDLALVNQATVVLTATAHSAAVPAAAAPRRGRRVAMPEAQPVDPSLTFSITIVARENFDGGVRVLKSWVTDNRHLDVYPQMELIDAVDADGDGRGELLFRSINDLGRSFVIYRVSADQLVPLYDSAQLSQ
jgi:hypothetical protein